MIITKTPFRISFAGGGSDLPSFYEKHGGCVLSTSINKYMYLSVHPYFLEQKTVLKYSKTEIVDSIEQIEHRIFNCVLNELNVSGVEITSTADMPAGTGLGSSSSFTVGLLHTLYCYIGKYRSKDYIAEKACEIEIQKLGNPIGKQDQYAAALGGLNFIRFNPDGTVSHEPIVLTPKTSARLRDCLQLYHLDSTRSANDILSEQKNNMSDDVKVNNLLQMCRLAEEMKEALVNDDISTFGKFLRKGWELKQSLASGISNPQINALYERGLEAGASGGKLLGAGGGGFLLFYCEPEKQECLRLALGLRRVGFDFERDGTNIVYIGERYW
ncbi:GHMP kinase [Clostridia bacterium]|nr:GHMP kinase [Clostridia bacterium]GHV34855.1 GHMP kinase [Clostridia bacterium]